MIRSRKRSNASRLGFIDWLASGEPLASVGRWLAWTGLGLGVLVPIIVAVPLPAVVKVLAVLAFASFGTGSAVCCKVRLGSASVSLALAFVLSLAIFAVPAGVMIWIRHWQPMTAFYVLDGLTIVLALWGLAPTFLANTPTGRWAQASRVLRAESLLEARAMDASTHTQVMSPIRDEWQTTLIQRVTDDPSHDSGSHAAGPDDSGAAGGGPRNPANAVPAAADRRADLHVPVPRSEMTEPQAESDPPDTQSGTPADQTAIIQMPRNDETAVIHMPADIRSDATAVIHMSSDIRSDGTVATVPDTAGPIDDTATAVIQMPALWAQDSARDLPPMADQTQLLPAAVESSETAIQTWRDVAELRDARRRADDTGDIPRVRGWHVPWAVERALTHPTLLATAQISLLAGGLALWIVSLRLTDVTSIGEFGLLSVMHPTFVAALAVCIVGFVTEIARGARRTWLLLAHVILLLLILHATVPILIPEPEYAWTYKHVGVIDLFQTIGHVVDSTDIYQAWPMFFAAVAQLASVSGGNALRIASWGPLFFDAANCLPLYAIIRSLTTDRRLPYVTVFLFTCINWVAQDYLSPQAFVYVLCLGALLVMVRWLRRPAGSTNVRPRVLARLWQRSQDGLAALPYVGKRTEWIALGCLYLVDAVVAVSHQLSPYFVAMSAIALVVLGLVRTWQIAPILVALPMLYLIPTYHVADHYGIFDGINIFGTIFKSTQGVSPTTTTSSHGQIISAAVVQVLTFVLWGLAAISVVASRRRLATVALPAVLTVAPFPMLLAQSYGGEVIYRVFLFSAPWTAYLICRLALRATRVPIAMAVIGSSLAIWLFALGGIQGEHGQLSFDRFTVNEVRATQWVYDNAPKGSFIVAPGGNLPSKLNYRYVDVSAGVGPIDLIDRLSEGDATVTPAELEMVTNYCVDLGKPVYLVITVGMINYDHYFGYLPDGKIANLRIAVATSPFWKAVFVTPDAVVFQLDAT